MDFFELTKMYLLVMLLALTVERIMEIFSAVWSFIEWKAKMNVFWNNKAEKLGRKFERKAKSQILLRKFNLDQLIQQISYATKAAKERHSGKLTIISAEMIRQTSIAAVSRVVASILGVIFCAATNVNLIVIFEDAIPIAGLKLTNWPLWIQLTISGVVIGLGSEPVHSLVTSLDKRREGRKESQKQKAELEKALAARTQ